MDSQKGTIILTTTHMVITWAFVALMAELGGARPGDAAAAAGLAQRGADRALGCKGRRFWLFKVLLQRGYR